MYDDLIYVFSYNDINKLNIKLCSYTKCTLQKNEIYAGELYETTRLCLDRKCRSYSTVTDGYGEDRNCCSGDLCNEW